MFLHYNNVNNIWQIIEILTTNSCLEINPMQCKTRGGGGVNAADMFFCFVFYKIVSTFFYYQSVIIFIDVYTHSFLREANQTELSSEKKDNHKY